MNYHLLTGATGLLGRYLMKDLALAGVPLAVIVRAGRRQTAVQRIDAILSYWDDQLGTPIDRPKVIEGDLCQSDLGMAPQDIQWVAENCDACIHNAASLSFVTTGRDAEPWVSNVDGTRNVLDVCQQAGIRTFHHVSTAYIAGLRNGICREDELDVGQTWGNCYEESKVEAEKMVRSADYLDSVTVHRPGIIVGDAKTGFTNTFHGFYAALQLVHTINQQLEPQAAGLKCSKDVRLSLTGLETKNLVPVDWVSAVMSYVISHPEHHQKTYHLTPRHPVTMRLIRDVLEGASGFYGTFFIGQEEMPQPNDLERLFYENIRVYNSYWRKDPTFDTTNTQAAAPHLPCPHVDFDLLMFLARTAIDMRFQWRDKLIVPERERVTA